MSTIHIKLCVPASGQTYGYRLCSHRLIANAKLKTLSAFALATDSKIDNYTSSELFDDQHKKLIYKGKNWIAEGDREISCHKVANGYIIDVPDITGFFVHDRGKEITQYQTNTPPASSTEERESMLLGPPIMLVFALNNYFGLHASAVDISGKAVLFAGESGYGKSTLAHHLNRIVPIKRLSDDISMLSSRSADFVLDAEFPQLKLAAQEQTSTSAAIKIAAVIKLDRRKDWCKVALNKLESFHAIQVLLNNSVAAQLFDSKLAKDHLGFMSDVAESTPVYQLTYPNGLDKIPEIAQILQDEFD